MLFAIISSPLAAKLYLLLWILWRMKRTISCLVSIVLLFVYLQRYEASETTTTTTTTTTPCVFDFILLPTGQGLVSQLVELRNFWSQTQKTRRVYTSLHFSSHFQDAGMYSMCDIFDFKDSVSCLAITANQVLQVASQPICNFHVFSHLLLIYMCKLHWNRFMKSGPFLFVSFLLLSLFTCLFFCYSHISFIFHFEVLFLFSHSLDYWKSK